MSVEAGTHKPAGSALRLTIGCETSSYYELSEGHMVKTLTKTNTLNFSLPRTLPLSQSVSWSSETV